jgi:hypothetical protein
MVRMKRRGLLWAGILAALLACVLVLVLLFRRDAQAWTLPDGSTLRLVKVTWGTNHLCRYGYRPIDLIYPLVPAISRSNFNFRVARISASPPGAMVVWFKRSGIPANAASPTPTSRTVTGTRGAPSPGGTPRLSASSTPFMVSVVDDHGVESRTRAGV